MPSTPYVVRSLRMCGSMCYNTVVGSAPSYLSELLAAAQPFPLSPLFIGHMHACPKNKKLPPQNSWLSPFLTPQSSHLEQSPPGLQSGLSSQGITYHHGQLLLQTVVRLPQFQHNIIAPVNGSRSHLSSWTAAVNSSVSLPSSVPALYNCTTERFQEPPTLMDKCCCRL